MAKSHAYASHSIMLSGAYFAIDLYLLLRFKEDVILPNFAILKK